MSFTALGCADGASGDGAAPDAGSEELGEEDPYSTLPNDDSAFTGKLIFSSPAGWPVNIFDFDTNTFALSREVDHSDSWAASTVHADLDPTGTYAAFEQSDPDGLLTGKTSQVVLRDVASEQEWAVPFETGDPSKVLNSFGPSVSGTGVVVLEHFIERLGEGGLPVETIEEGISFWSGTGQPLALAPSVENPRNPRIASDGSVFFVGDNDEGERVIWKTSVNADVPVMVGVPAGDELLSVNSVPVFDISDDGDTLIFRTYEGDISRIHYTTATRSGSVEFTGSPLAVGLSGDGSTLMAVTIGDGTTRQLQKIALGDGSRAVVDEGSLEMGFFPLVGLAVSRTGDAVAMVVSERDPSTTEPNLFSLYVFEPGGFGSAQRVIRDSYYGGLTSPALAVRFRGELE